MNPYQLIIIIPILLVFQSSITAKNDTDLKSTLKDKPGPLARELQVNPITKKKIMLLQDHGQGINETRQMVMDSTLDQGPFSRIDFIIRLQEKYEGSTCHGYLNSVPDWQNLYFQYDEDLINIENKEHPWNDTDLTGTPESRQNRKQKAADTQPDRYRFWGEPCNPEAEYDFWKTLFLASENDTIAIPKSPPPPPCTPSPNMNCPSSSQPSPPPSTYNRKKVDQGNPEEFDYVQIDAQTMMKIWNDIWLQFEDKGVCNPRLLLECPVADQVIPNSKDLPYAYSEVNKCRCRSNGVGLPTIILQKSPNVTKYVYKIPANVFTRQYYEDLEENVHGATVRRYGRYVHKKKCIVAAHVPYTWKDGQILNPCDFFLPMIGMCSAPCHKNATCQFVKDEEKEIFLEYSKKVDPLTRLRTQKVHGVYHQKCVCRKGHTCRKENEIEFASAPSIFFTKQTNLKKLIIFLLIIIFKN